MISYITFWQNPSETTLAQKFENENRAYWLLTETLQAVQKTEKVVCLQFECWVSLVVFTKERHKYRFQTTWSLWGGCVILVESLIVNSTIFYSLPRNYFKDILKTLGGCCKFWWGRLNFRKAWWWELGVK